MKWIVRALAALLVVVALVVALLFLLPAERIAGVALERVSASLGREIRVEGPVRPTLWPTLGVSTGRVTVANADWAGEEPLADIAGVVVGVEPWPLLSGEVRVTELLLDTPVLTLSTDAEGRGNWVFGTGDDPAAVDAAAADETTAGETAPEGGDAPSQALSLDLARIEDGRLRFTPADGTPVALDDLDAELTLPGFDRPARLDLTAMSGNAPVALTADLDSLGGTLGPGGAAAVELRAGDASAVYEGTLGLGPLNGEGRLTADLSDMGGLFAVLGQAAPVLPEGLGRDTLTAEAIVGLAPGAVTLGDLAATLDGNRVTGDLAVGLDGPRPRLTGRLDLGAFALPEDEAEGDGGDAAAGDGPDGWSTEPIDTAWMGTMDADIAVQAASLAFGATEIGATDLQVTLDDRRLVTAIRRLSAYDGEVAGEAVLNGRDGTSAALDVDGSAIAISRLLSELLDYDRIVAAGNLALSVQGAGASMDAILNAMDGGGRFEVGAGELLGLDIVGLLRTMDPKVLRAGSSTLFDSIVGTFRIEDGVVTNQDLAIAAPLFAAEGEGSIGIGGRTLDYTLSPHLLDGDRADIRIPIRITGTWDAPRFGVDLKAMASGAAEGELRRRAAEELGVAPDAVEDAAKERLGDEVRKGLGRLFGR